MGGHVRANVVTGLAGAGTVMVTAQTNWELEAAFETGVDFGTD